MQQYFRNSSKSQNETYTGERLFLIQEEPFWEMVGVCTLAKNKMPYLKAKQLRKFILVYFQCFLWILHLEIYLGTKIHGQVISITWVIIKNASLSALLRAFLRWSRPKLKIPVTPEPQIIGWQKSCQRLLPSMSLF